ncbi:MAG: RtcB family protein [Chloroflexi bacterium]|nr:RtcB family protein [Chloroflexota bacterium]
MADKGFTRIAPFLYEAPASLRSDMRVPAHLYADEILFKQAADDRSLSQLINTATLPGIVGYALAMPDIHEGYGFPIGGVVATSWSDGIVSPGGVGYDINCGVRLLTSHLSVSDIRPVLEDLLRLLYQTIPSGVGETGKVHLKQSDLKLVLEQGAEWALRRGLATESDLAHTEDYGKLDGADIDALSARARERGLGQLGTLGSGNHFVEIDEITEVYDQAAASALGIFRGQVCIWLHSGSRGLGHQVCTDAVSSMQRGVAKSGIKLADRELVYVQCNSAEGRRYWTAMNGAANYAWANRQVMTQQVRECLARVLGRETDGAELRVLYDVCHNIAKREVHQFEGRRIELCVHRKGATRAFGPGQQQLPEDYRSLGQPVLVPGSMGTSSYICLGTQAAMEQTFGSACHGAGRQLSRTEARKRIQGEQLRAQLAEHNILLQAGSMEVTEEAPQAYKDVDGVVNVVHQAGLVRKVARTQPLAVMKG